MEKIILLNGPPNSGKDTIADLLSQFDFEKFEMKSQLYRDTAAFFHIDRYRLEHLAKNRILKEHPSAELTYQGLCYSPREALIFVSEKQIKPEYGKAYFGEKLAQQILLRQPRNVVISDCGFIEEVKPVVDLFPDALIFRLQRKGCSFDNDSRDYITAYPDRTYDIEIIDDKPMKAVMDILKIVSFCNMSTLDNMTNIPSVI